MKRLAYLFVMVMLAACSANEPGGNKNAAPVANSQKISTAENTPVAITLRGTDSDGDFLTYAVVAQTAHGSITGSAPNLTYTPNNDFNGSDSFTFKVNDGNADSAEATISITVGSATAPVFTSTPVTTSIKDELYSYIVTSTDPQGDTCTITTTRKPAWLTLTDNGDGSASLAGTPRAADIGNHLVTLKIMDGTGASTEQSFSVSVVERVHVVTNSNDSGAGSLRQIVSSVNAGATITFADNVTTIALTSGEIALAKDVTIQGRVTLDGTNNSQLFSVRSGVFAVSSGVSVTLKDITITNGANEYSTAANVYNAGTLILQDVKITNARERPSVYNKGVLTLRGNSSISGSTNVFGGAVYNIGTLILQDNSTISNNSGGAGGGVFNSTYATLILQDDSSISNNTATSQGGGVYNVGSLTLQDNSSISGNTASSGGGVDNRSDITLEGNSSVSNNTASNGSGGGIDNNGSIALTGTSSISGNTASFGGGIFSSQGTTIVTLQDTSSISGNTATFEGGGVYVHNNGGTLILEADASISSNTASDGGGVFNFYGNITLTGNSSIFGNKGTRGGGIYNYYGQLTGADYDGANGNDNIFGNTPDQVYDIR